EVTFEDFLSYIHEKPEWLYGKLRLIHERFKDVIEDREARLAESELNGQAKDGEILLMKNRQYTSSQGRMDTTASTTTGATVKKEPGTPSLTTYTARMNDRSQLMREGKCFNCHERGHLSIDCPKKQKSDLKELEGTTEQNQTTQNDSENV